MAINFYPRPPRGGRPICSRLRRSRTKFLSTPSARRATGNGPHPCRSCTISIHALREEGDVGEFSVITLCNISIHALREEGDGHRNDDPRWDAEFLSTPSARRATIFRVAHSYLSKFLSTPSARRATRRTSPKSVESTYFYPRPPRGGRHKNLRVYFNIERFLSTPSARRATNSFGTI